MDSFRYLAQRAHHGLWSLLDALAWPVGLLALAPAVIHLQDLEAYGAIAYFTALLGFVPLACFGLQTVLLQSLPSAGQGRGFANASELAGAAYLLAATVAATIMSLGMVAYLVLPDGGLPIVAAEERPIYGMALALGVIAVAFDQVSVGVLKGTLRFKESALLEVLSRGMQVGCTILVAWFTGEPARLAAALGASMLAGATLRAVAAAVSVKPRISAAPSRDARMLASRGAWIVAQSVGGFPYMGFDRIIVGSLLGSSVLAIYAICVQFAQVAHMIPAALFQPVLPWVARRRSSGDLQQARRMVAAVLGACAAVTVAISLVLVAASPLLLPAWLRRPLAPGELYAFWSAVAAAGLMGIGVGPHYFMLGLGKFRLMAALNLAAGVGFTILLVIAARTGDVLACSLSRVSSGAILMAVWWWVWKALRAGTGSLAPALGCERE